MNPGGAAAASPVSSWVPGSVRAGWTVGRTERTDRGSDVETGWGALLWPLLNSTRPRPAARVVRPHGKGPARSHYHQPLRWGKVRGAAGSRDLTPTARSGPGRGLFALHCKPRPPVRGRSRGPPVSQFGGSDGLFGQRGAAVVGGSRALGEWAGRVACWCWKARGGSRLGGGKSEAGDKDASHRGPALGPSVRLSSPPQSLLLL